jgi:hypothetical protein
MRPTRWTADRVPPATGPTRPEKSSTAMFGSMNKSVCVGVTNFGGIILVAKDAVHGVTVTTGRSAWPGAERQLIGWTEVNRLALEVGIQLTGCKIEVRLPSRCLEPPQKVRQHIFVVLRIHRGGQAKLTHVASTHGSPSRLFPPVQYREQHRRRIAMMAITTRSSIRVKPRFLVQTFIATFPGGVDGRCSNFALYSWG